MFTVLKKCLEYVYNAGVASTIKKIYSILQFKLVTKSDVFIKGSIYIRNNEPIEIITHLHTLYIAELIQDTLSKFGIQSNIITKEPYSYNDKLYIVIAPQVFWSLPTKRVIFFQVEQAHSTWMTNTYIKLLKKADLVFDYSKNNIQKIIYEGLDSSKLFYLPLSPKYIENLSCNRNIDIVFYGNINSPRRKNFLTILKKHFKIKVLNNIYGDELKNILKKTKIVLNIHYYNEALLETTRICEAISYGCLVISEKTQDSNQYPELNNLVDFIDCNDINNMITRIRYWLSHDKELMSKQNNNIKLVQNSQSIFYTCFHKFLFDYINFDKNVHNQ